MRYEETGGIRVNNFLSWGWSATWPFAKLMLDGEKLTISTIFNKEYQFEDGNVLIDQVKYVPLIAEGIRLTDKRTNKVIYFWSMNSDRLMKKLRNFKFRTR